jgi:rhamnosyltransferase subunit B
MPMAYDQLDNGLRLARLGVGAVVPRRKFKAARVAELLRSLLGADEVARRCRELADRCDGPASLNAACDRLEQLLVSNGRASPITPANLGKSRLP